MSDPYALIDNIGRHVHEGLWQDYNKPSYKCWVWTLRNTHALLVLAVFTLLITLSQRQSWAIVRNRVARWKGPVRLRDDTCSDPLKHLSQYDAMEDVFLLVRSIFNERFNSLYQRPSRATDDNRPGTILENATISPYFGAFAFTNIVFFIVAGVVIPWLLSEGWQSASIVRSKLDVECLNSRFQDHLNTFIYELPKVDAIFDECLGQLDGGCDKRFHLQKPKIEVARPSECPFRKKICIEETRPIELTHYNFTAFEAGINLKSNISINRRLTCTPINLFPMMFWGNFSGETGVYLTTENIKKTGGISLPLSLKLRTLNGPNRISNTSSGRTLAEVNGAKDISVLPHSTIWRSNRSLKLWAHDVEPFFIVRRGGATKFLKNVDDPFFTAHQNFTNKFGSTSQYSDHEATAIGCHQQVQYCLLDSTTCSEWGTFRQLRSFILGDSDRKPLLRSVFSNGEYNRLVDQYLVVQSLVEFFSLHGFLGDRFTYWKIMPPLSEDNDGYARMDHDEQWVVEVEKWFRKAYLNGIFRVQNGARWNQDVVSPPYPARIHTLCGRVIFYDNEHTNINILGLCSCCLALCLLCLSSSLAKPARTVALGLKRFTLCCIRGASYIYEKLGCLQKIIHNKTVSASSDSRNTGDPGGGGGSTDKANKLSAYVQIMLTIMHRVNDCFYGWSAKPQQAVQPITLDSLDTCTTTSRAAAVAATTLTDLERFEDFDNVT